MKSKLILYTVLLILLMPFSMAFSQNEYFEPGAVWHHQYTLYYTPKGYSKTFVNGSVMVAGVQAVKLSGEYSSKDQTSPTTYVYSGIVPLPDMYMRSSNDSVFIFREGAFHLAYKTNAVVGEVWDLGPNANYPNVQDNHSYLRVDSVYYKNVNGEYLRHINTTACYSNGFDLPQIGTSFAPYLYPMYQGIINEKYGPSKNFREMLIVAYADSSSIIDYYQNQFLCYESDSTVQLSSYPNVDCYQNVYLDLEEKEAELFHVSPNPSNDVFEFKNFANTESEITISNSQGRIIFVVKSKDDCRVDISAHPSGTYIANIRSVHSVQTIRLVKM